MSFNLIDLGEAYKNYFGNSPFYISQESGKKTEEEPFVLTQNPNPKGSVFYSRKGISLNKTNAYGKAVWFPITFWKNNQQVIEIETCTVSVNLSKTVIKTAVSERKGTVKEIFGIDDYKFTIKGFLIDKRRIFPEDQILILKEIFETTDPVELHGGYPELFLDESCRVVITSLDFPEAQGKAVYMRPFTMTLESDFIQDLELD